MVTISKAAARRPARRSDAPDNMFELDASSVSGRGGLQREATQPRWKQPVAHHDEICRRADSMAKNMLLRSRSGPRRRWNSAKLWLRIGQIAVQEV